MQPSTTDTPAPFPEYFRWIDGLRGVAALAVVVFHYQHFYLPKAADHASVPAVSEFPWASIFSPFFHHGEGAVQLFWVISGFVFAHVYFQRATTLGGFVVARIARLYPLHFATLMIAAALQVISLAWVGHWQIYDNNDLRHFGLHLVMSSNWTIFSRGLTFNGPIWSVSLELVAYAIFFLALPLLRAWGLLAATALAAAMWMLGVADFLEIPGISKGAFVCAGYFFVGNSTYLILRRTGAQRGLAWALALAAGLVASFGLWQGIHHLTLLGFSTTVVTLVALIDMRWSRAPIAGLRRLGDMSYSIYLVHVPLQMLLLFVADAAFDGTRAFATSPLTLPIFLGVTLVVADLVYRHFEVPAGRFLRRKLSGPKPQPAQN